MNIQEVKQHNEYSLAHLNIYDIKQHDEYALKDMNIHYVRQQDGFAIMHALTYNDQVDKFNDY